ncbi:Lar family restriction alleviation protein [Providencia heimbachae]
MSELKKCPFCGGEAELIDNRLGWYARCQNDDCSCTVIGERVEEPQSEAESDAIDWDSVRQTAIAAWNRRANSEQ